MGTTSFPVRGGSAGGCLAASPAPGWWRLGWDSSNRTPMLPRWVELDLGATAKALAADQAATGIAGELGGGVLVNPAGDIALAGPRRRGMEDYDRETITVPHPGRPPRSHHRSRWPADSRDHHRGLATSGTTRCRWRRGGVLRHHIVDPRTGASASEVWRTVSVATASWVDANTASTAAIVLGTAAPRRGWPRWGYRPGWSPRTAAYARWPAGPTRSTWWPGEPGVVDPGPATGIGRVATAVSHDRDRRGPHWAPHQLAVARFIVAALHRTLVLMSVVCLAAHLRDAVLNSYTGIRWFEAVVPFVAPEQPLCLRPTAAAGLAASAQEVFNDDLAAHLAGRPCPAAADRYPLIGLS